MWTGAEESSFQALKQALISAPILALPNLQKPFVIEINASDKWIGAVLQQDGHHRNQALSTYEKECLAIQLAVEHWGSFLQHNEFTLKIDQRSLVHLDDQRLTTPWQHKALTKLLGLRYKIYYKQGAENRAADAQSQVPRGPHQEVYALSVLKSAMLQELTDNTCTLLL